jgi:chemotaxis protein MotD
LPVPRVALPPSVPSNHDLATRARAPAADPARPSSPFAALLDGGGDSTPAAPDRRQPGATTRSAPRSDGETGVEPAAPRPGETPDATEPDAVISPAITTIVAAGKAIEAGAGSEAEAIPADDAGDDEAAALDAAEAALLAAATDGPTVPDTAAPPVPASDQPAAPVDQPPTPVAGLAIAAATPAADPLPADAAATETDPVLSPRPGAAAVIAGRADAPAPPAQGAMPSDEAPAATPAAATPAGNRPQAAAATAPSAAQMTRDTAAETTAAAAPAETDGAPGEARDGEHLHPKSEIEQPRADAVRGREDAPQAAERAPSRAPAESKPDDAAPTGKPPADPLQPNGLQPAFDRHLTAASAPTAAAATTASAATASAVPVEGLAVEIAARAQAGRNRFEIRLDPPELGRIDVRLDVDRSGHVTSRLIVERAETLDLLRRDAPELERALQQAGLKTSDNGLQFMLRDQAFAGRDDERAPDAARLIVPAANTDAAESLQRGYGRMLRLGGGIDIRV